MGIGNREKIIITNKTLSACANIGTGSISNCCASTDVDGNKDKYQHGFNGNFVGSNTASMIKHYAKENVYIKEFIGAQESRGIYATLF